MIELRILYADDMLNIIEYLKNAQKDSTYQELNHEARSRFDDLTEGLEKATQQQFPNISAVQIFAGDNFAVLGECDSARVAYRTAFGAEYGLVQERLIAVHRYQCLSSRGPDKDMDRFIEAFEPKRGIGGIVPIARLAFATTNASVLMSLQSIASGESDEIDIAPNTNPSELMPEKTVCACSQTQDLRKMLVGW